MIFSSYIFLAFFCIVIAVHLSLHLIANQKVKTLAIKSWLLVASIIFYSYWGWADLAIVCVSLVFNFYAGRQLYRLEGRRKKQMLFFSVFFNLGLIGYFKYTNFLLEPVSLLFGPIPELDLLLPLGISFYTFQQIAYLVDCSKRKTEKRTFLDYSIFVLFFPQLVAGPIVSHRKIIPQLVAKTWEKINGHLFALGVALFSVGLFKKVFMADNLAILVNAGYESVDPLSFIDAWVATLSFTFQMYFDFSGYSDMALGIGLMLGIRLPINFNSPFQASNIQQGWAGWNMTLGQFFHSHLFKPLGGYGRSVPKQAVALFVTMMLVGIWHGGTWLFVLWGAAQGFGLVLHRVWRKANIDLPTWLGITITFLFANFTFVLIRSTGLGQAADMYAALTNVQPFVDVGLWQYAVSSAWNDMLGWVSNSASKVSLLVLCLSFWIIFFCKNSNQILAVKNLSMSLLCRSLVAMVLAIIFLSGEKEFIYFVF